MKGPRVFLSLLLILLSVASVPSSALAYSGREAPPLANAAHGSQATGPTRYTVKRGDTLSSIASRFGVSAAAIARANGIKNQDMLRAGATLTIPGSSAAGPATGSTGNTAPAGSGLRFVASISQQSCALYRGNVAQARWRCSTGRPGSATRPGTYRVRTKLSRAWGGTWGWWLPYWLGIYMAGSMENGIHGLPYSAGSGRKYWGNSIGSPVSYGCVVLDDASARALYNVAYVGMPVTILP